MSHNKILNSNDTKTHTKESLFSIGEPFYALETLLIENEGEIDQTIDRWLQEYEAKEEDKVDAYCYLIQKFEEIAAEAKRLADRSSGYQKKSKTLKDRLKFYLQHRGKDKLETGRFTVTVNFNGGMMPVILNEGITVDSLPDEFVKIYKEPDMFSLRESILAGNDQALMFGKILPRGTHLRIK